ncbi:MAG: MGH1-like glycoside hydrolase domain-containing protein [Solirubrobacteraceae bacterium]
MAPPMETHDAIRATCERVLRQNWREGRANVDGTPFAYTCPSPRHYPWQWYWDSSFTAISWRHFDPDHSRRELQSLLAAQRPDGFIGHTIFWNTPLSGVRRFTYNVTEPGAPATASIQPPVLAWAWQIAVGDPRGVPGIVRHHDWLQANRDLDGDGLIWIVQPDESGLDASPQFDAIWGSSGPQPPWLRPARPAQSAASLRRPGDRGRRRSGVLRGHDERALLAVALRARPSVADGADPRADVRRAKRTVPSSRPPSPGSRTGAHLDRALTPRPPRSAGGDRARARRTSPA